MKEHQKFKPTVVNTPAKEYTTTLVKTLDTTVLSIEVYVGTYFMVSFHSFPCVKSMGRYIYQINIQIHIHMCTH